MALVGTTIVIVPSGSEGAGWIGRDKRPCGRSNLKDRRGRGAVRWRISHPYCVVNGG
jgi:hypothetical protein